MGQKVFIPVTDEILYEHPELITSPLMPFQVDQPCFRWLSAEVEAVDPATVDIDTSVELNIPPTALNFSPTHVSHSSSSAQSSAVGSPSLQTSDPDQYYQPFQHILKKRQTLPCKDAA